MIIMKGVSVNKAVVAILSAAIITNAFACEGADGDESSAERYRYLLTCYIKMKSPYCVFGIHDAIERFKFDLNIKDKNGLTPLALAEKEENLAATTYLKWREAKDTNPELAMQLSKDLTTMVDERTNHLIAEGIVKSPNTTTAATVFTTSAPAAQSLPAPTLRSPEISGYSGPKRLPESPNQRTRNHNDDDDE
jgi:hypothetical protein